MKPSRPSRPVCASVLRVRRRAALLLEVVVSLGILMVAMGVVGLAFRNGHHNVELAERKTRALLMTERLIAEMDTKLLDVEEQEQSGYFGDESIPNMSWRVEVEDSDRVRGLLEIDVYIYMGDPEGTVEERELVLHTRLFRAEPRGIDFEQDFGLSEDQIQQLTDVIPGGTQVLDPTNFDPRSLAQLDLDTLVELLPTLIQAFGLNLAQGQIDQIIQAAETGDLDALQNLAGQTSGTGNLATPPTPSEGGDAGSGAGQRRGDGGRRGGGG